MTSSTPLRALFVAGFCLFAAPTMFSCHDDGPIAPPVPDTIRAFVETQNLPLLREIRVDLSIPKRQLAFFHALYGHPHDCPAGCFYSSAYGVQLGDKLGWITVNDLERLPVEQLAFYNLESNDAPLFEETTWVQLETSAGWILWSAFFPYLAVDEDSPHEALLRIAQRLDEYISPHIASKLLANPRIQLYPDVLQLVACLPVFSGDAYEWVRMTAREMLGASFPGCEAGAI